VGLRRGRRGRELRGFGRVAGMTRGLGDSIGVIPVWHRWPSGSMRCGRRRVEASEDARCDVRVAGSGPWRLTAHVCPAPIDVFLRVLAL
jgi:hypothetical protein